MNAAQEFKYKSQTLKN